MCRRRQTRTRSGSPGIWASLHLKSFYKAELPAAVNSSFQTVLVNGACTQRWASCLYMFGSRPDACSCVRWAERPDVSECWTGGQLGHPIWPLYRMRAPQRSNKLYDNVRGIFCPYYSADVLILFRSVYPLSGYNLCWHCVMGMYRRPLRRATAMASKAVRTTSHFFCSILR
jgi:hypothetical protein